MREVNERNGHPSRHLAARWLPWLVGFGLLPFLLVRIRPAEIEEALRRGPAVALIAFTVFHFLAAFASDVAATRVGLSVLGFRRPLREVLSLRGASYLAGLLNFTLGQGAIAYHLARQGVRVTTAAGATFVLVLVNFLSLALLVLVGFLAFAPLNAAQNGALVVSAGVIVGLSVLFYSLRPNWLRKWSAAGPLLETAPVLHLKALAARTAHFILVSVLHWIALRIWGIEVPLGDGMALVALLLFVGALPIAPNGVGTVQVTHVLLFSAYVSAPTQGTREAAALAFSVVQAATALVSQALLGLYYFLRWRRGHSAVSSQARWL